jgi:hypothetical protein
MSSDAMAAPAPTPAPVYPFRFDVHYADKLNRWLNNPFLGWIKIILAIPHILILLALSALTAVITVIAFLSILFTRKYPEGLWEFSVNVMRWGANVGAYVGQMRDEYPPFSWDPGKYPVTLEADHAPLMGRWMPLVKTWPTQIVLIPQWIVFIFVLIVAVFAWIIGSFAILFTGHWPRGLFNFVVGTSRWGNRIVAYNRMLTDKYPPFSMK